MKLLLHACCGPCSLEPVRLLQEAGHELTIYYTNSNIAPEAEYQQRLDTLRAWTQGEHLSVLEGLRDIDTWEHTVGRIGDAALLAARDHNASHNRALALSVDPAQRKARCRACYRMRLEETARVAARNDFDGIGTTLSVSPYQYTDVIRQEVERAAAQEGICAVFEDFRPFYEEATRRSRALGMYRQNYCGCRFSDDEAAAERTERKQARAAAKAAKAALQAEERAAQEASKAARKEQRAAYDAKQAHKRAVLKALREKERSEDNSNAKNDL